MGEVVVTVVGEAKLEDLAADVFWEGAGGREEVAIAEGGVGQGWVEGVLIGEPGNGVVVVVDADKDAVVGIGSAGARKEAEGREVAGLAAAAAYSASKAAGSGVTRSGGKYRARCDLSEKWISPATALTLLRARRDGVL